MKFVRILLYMLSAPALLGALLLLAGCESETSDPIDVDSYFQTNTYVSAERDEPLPPTLEISPASAQIGIVGQQVVFTASGGTGSYHWAISSADNGEFVSGGANQIIYTCKKVANNTVSVHDDGGHYATAQVTPGADKMTIAPASASLSSGARYVAFSVSGGTAPYVWVVGNASLGSIAYSAATSYTAGYTAVAGAYGQNTITVQDAEGRVASATVTQAQ